MVILQPNEFRFDGVAWTGVIAFAVDRSAARLVEAFSDAGGFTTFADVPEQRVRISVTQELHATDLPGVTLGASAPFEVFMAPTRTDAGRIKVFGRAVVTAVEHEISGAPRLMARRTVTMLAIAIDGRSDPIFVDPAENLGA